MSWSTVFAWVPSRASFRTLGRHGWHCRRELWCLETTPSRSSDGRAAEIALELSQRLTYPRQYSVRRAAPVHRAGRDRARPLGGGCVHARAGHHQRRRPLGGRRRALVWWPAANRERDRNTDPLRLPRPGRAHPRRRCQRPEQLARRGRRRSGRSSASRSCSRACVRSPSSGRSRGSRSRWLTSRTCTTSSPPGRKTRSPSAASSPRATERWSTPPRFVLIAGAATYDPRGLARPARSSTRSRLLVIQTRYIETASDDALVTFDCDAGPALAIGRLPMSSAADMDAAVAKIVGRRLAMPEDTLLLVRDRDGTIPFSAASAEVRSALSGWRTQDFARGADDAASHTALLEALRAGPLAVDYQGHGAEDFWTGRILSTHGRRRALGCWKQPRSSSPRPASTRTSSTSAARRSGRPSLRTPNGGAWGVWASSAETVPTEHALLSKTLLCCRAERRA